MFYENAERMKIILSLLRILLALVALYGIYIAFSWAIMAEVILVPLFFALLIIYRLLLRAKIKSAVVVAIAIVVVIAAALVYSWFFHQAVRAECNSDKDCRTNESCVLVGPATTLGQPKVCWPKNEPYPN